MFSPDLDLEMIDAWYKPIQKLIDVYEEGEELFHNSMEEVLRQTKPTLNEVAYKRYLNMDFLPTIYTSKWKYVYRHVTYNYVKEVKIKVDGSGYRDFYLEIAKAYARGDDDNVFGLMQHVLYREPTLRPLVRKAREVYNATQVLDELVE